MKKCYANEEHEGTFIPGDTVAIGLMLFALFLGAGNLIFRQFYNKQERMFDCYNRIPCNRSRITPTSCNSCRVCRGDLKALSSRVHPIFAFIFPLISYLAIGPFFAIPRTELFRLKWV